MRLRKEVCNATLWSLHNFSKNRNFGAEYYGPFRIQENIGVFAYNLLLLEGCELRPSYIPCVNQHKKPLDPLLSLMLFYHSSILMAPSWLNMKSFGNTNSFQENMLHQHSYCLVVDHVEKPTGGTSNLGRLHIYAEDLSKVHGLRTS